MKDALGSVVSDIEEVAVSLLLFVDAQVFSAVRNAKQQPIYLPTPFRKVYGLTSSKVCSATGSISMVQQAALEQFPSTQLLFPLPRPPPLLLAVQLLSLIET